jgi:hypothetical protein
MADESNLEKKRKYESPAITVISLRPEEAVLGNCKSHSIGGPVQSSCSNLPGCSSVGS